MNTFEMALLLNGYNINEAKRKLEALHKLKDEEYLEFQKQRLDEIVCFHRKNNPVYKKKIDGLQINSFEDLPVITKKDFQRPIKEIVSKGYKKSDLYIGCTSGSSGCPLSYAKNKYSHALSHAIVLSRMADYGITPLCKQARFYGSPLSGISKYKALLKDILANRVCFSASDLSDEQLDCTVQKFKKIKFDYIYGYTSAIVLFAKYLVRNKIKFKEIAPNVKCCIVACEVCTSENRALLENVFGIKIINEYGTSEVGIIAFGDDETDWKIMTDDLYCEVVDDMNRPLSYGQEGKLLITCLSNKAFPIIRYEVGDRGVLEEKDGRLFLKKLAGRISDLIRLPSGRIAAGETFHYIQKSMIEKQGVLREFIVKQTKIDTFELDMVLERDLTPDEINNLNADLATYLEPGLHLIINRLDKIKRPDSGKIKFFYSMIN